MELVDRRRRSGRVAGLGVVLVVVLALALGSAACGGSSDGAASPSPSPTADLATVPDLSTDHLQKAEAENEIESAGLVSKVEPTFVEDVPAGGVVSQLPEAGKQVAKGSQVAIWISLGPKMAEIPELVGEKGDTVGRLLKNVGLVGKRVDGASMKYPKGMCFKQQPGPKDQAPMGTTVVYYVSTGLPTVVVPNVVGKPLATAKKALTSRNLVVAGTVQHHSATVAKGSVISQSVPAGSEVVADTAVELTVSKGPAEVVLVVPDVVGEFADTVVPELQVSGFQNIYVDKVASEDQKGLIIKQLPRPGTRINPNEQLVLVVSGGPLFE
jgi:serine/threonine-protein kinase